MNIACLCQVMTDAATDLSLRTMIISREKLYCALTCMLINKNMESLRKHMKGKAFLKAKGDLPLVLILLLVAFEMPKTWH